MIARATKIIRYGIQENGFVRIVNPENAAPAPTEFYAHGAEDVITWAKTQPEFKDAHIDRFENGVVSITGPWTLLSEWWGLVKHAPETAQFQRAELAIYPVDTLHENFGAGWG